jgi:hypothetical protein
MHEYSSRRRVPTLNKLVPIGPGAAAAAVIVVLCVGCGSESSTVGEPPSSTPQPTAAAPSSAADDLLRDFLAARVAGEGAQQYLNVPKEDIPLLYATTSGAPYERAEFDRVGGIEWPYGFRAFVVRLFAGDTVVEQLFFVPYDDPVKFPADGRLGLEYQPDSFGTEIAPTTEDGRPVAVPYDTFDGELTLRVAHPWVFSHPSIRLIPEGPGVRPTTDGGERNDWDGLELTADPWLGGCRTGTSPADAEGLAEIIRSDPDLGATAPVAVSARGAQALMLDVVVAAGASVPFCENEAGGLLSSLVDQNAGQSFDGTGRATGNASGERMRLYLFDVPEGSSIRVLAIAIIAPESRFESVVEAAAPVVDSVEFHVR